MDRTLLRNRLTLVAVAIGCAAFIAVPGTLRLTAAPGEATDEVAPPRANERLADVVVEGNTTIPARAIARYIKARAGRPLTEGQIREDIKALYGTRWFITVEPVIRRTPEGLVLVYRVLEKPFVRRVEYRGLEKIKQKELEDLTGLRPGSPFEVSLNREAARRIESFLHEKGYAHATVKLLRGDQKDHRDVIFEIHEGPRVRVSGVDFVGNDSFSGPLLKTKLVTKPAILWFIGGLYDPATIPDDVNALKQYYFNLGYFDVQVDHQLEWNDEKSRVRIQYVIEEGERFKIGRRLIEGNEVFSQEELNEWMELGPGDYFNARLLSEDVSAVKKKYGELGRIFARVDAVPRYLEEPGVADLIYQIEEGKVWKIRRVDVKIRGDHPHTKRTEVLNRMYLHPGDLADPEKLRKSRLRVSDSIFYSAISDPQKGPRISFIPLDENGERIEQQHVRLQNADEDSVYRSVFDASESFSEIHPPSVPPLSRGRRQRSSTADASPDNESLAFAGHSLPDAGGTAAFTGGRRNPAFSEMPGFSGELKILPRDDYPLPFRNTPNPAFHVKSGSYFSRDKIFRGQTIEDGIRQPGDPAFGGSPQGDPFDQGLREPPPAYGDLLVEVEEQRTGRLMFGVGVNSDAGVVGSIVLSEQNFDIARFPTGFHDLGTAFRGGGQRFRAEAIPGNVVSRYALNWTDPYFLDTDFSVSVSGFFYNRFFDDWDEQRGGGRVSVGYQFSPEFSVNGTIRMEEVVIDNPDIPTPLILFQSLGSNFLQSFRVAAAHDTRDSPIFAGEGHFIETAYEQAFGEFNYPRFEVEARQYFTVYRRVDGGGRHIVTLAGQLGWTDVGTPIFERFFGGGFQSFRGFDFRGVGPRQFGVNIGGRWMALGTVQYQVPLLPNESIQAVVFSDFGTVENTVDFENFRLSVGTGLRLSVPGMGPVPLAFDFAFPILSEDFDDERIFSFYVDTNF